MFGLGIAAIDSVGHGEEPLLYLSEAVITTIASMLLVRRQLTAASSCTTVYRERNIQFLKIANRGATSRLRSASIASRPQWSVLLELLASPQSASPKSSSCRRHLLSLPYSATGLWLAATSSSNL